MPKCNRFVVAFRERRVRPSQTTAPAKLNGFLILILAAIVFTTDSIAQTNSLKIENRFLFILDTSSAMKRSTNAAQQVALQLIYNGMQGEMRTGDTFGLWTFNRELFAGKFPMQLWQAQANRSLAERAAQFLRIVPYEHTSDLKKVLMPLQSIIKASSSLTVVLISDGKQPIQGTPFDAEINATYKEYYRKLQEEKMPFVTVLSARNGKLVDYSVNSSIGPIRIPPVPHPPPVIAAVKPKPPVAKPAPILKNTNAPIHIRAEPKPVAPIPVVVTNQVALTTAPPTIVETNVALSVTNPSPLTNASPVKTETKTPNSEASNVVSIATSSPQTNLPSEVNVPPVELAKQNLNLEEKPNVEIQPSAPPIQNQSSPPATTNVEVKTQELPISTVLPSEPLSNSKRVWIIGIGLLAIIALLTSAVLARRNRSNSSLISQSMRRDKK